MNQQNQQMNQNQAGQNTQNPPLSDEELAAILSRKVGTITGEIAEQIKQKANRYQDNFTAIVVAVE
jgi:hypothetical protein